LAARLEAVPAGRELHVRFEDLDYIDHACLDLLINWGKQHSATGGTLIIDWDNLTAKFRQPGQYDLAGNGRNGGSASTKRFNGSNGSGNQAIAGGSSQHAKSA
jgi:hypothetical protein